MGITQGRDWGRTEEQESCGTSRRKRRGFPGAMEDLSLAQGEGGDLRVSEICDSSELLLRIPLELQQ